MVRTMAAIMAGVLLAGAQQPATRAEDCPRVWPVRGELQAWCAGARRIQRVQEPVRSMPGDRFGAKDGGYALLMTDGDTLVNMRGVRADREGGLAIERAGDKLLLKLYEGKLLLDAFETGVVVETRHGRVEGKEVYFLVETSEKETKVLVMDGQVALTNAVGALVVGGGETGSSSSGKAPGKTESREMDREMQGFAQAEAPQNLMRNPGFEEGDKGWNLHGASIEMKSAHAGTRCVRWEASSSVPESKTPPFCQDPNVKPGRRYLLRCYFRTETREGRFALQLRVLRSGKTGAWSREVECEKAWKMARLIATSEEASWCIAFSVEPRTEKFAGTVWADDLALIELPSPAGK